MMLQPNEVNVQYTDPKGAVTFFKEGAPMTTCAQGTGWEYSADMSQINLCGTACTLVEATMGGSLQVCFGCATQSSQPVK
jgi:hypothetical protein